jgi:hypothetical protein
MGSSSKTTTLLCFMFYGEDIKGSIKSRKKHKAMRSSEGEAIEKRKLQENNNKQGCSNNLGRKNLHGGTCTKFCSSSNVQMSSKHGQESLEGVKTELEYVQLLTSVRTPLFSSCNSGCILITQTHKHKHTNVRP